MVGAEKIQISQVKESRLGETDFEKVPFGKVFSDHMFVMEYADGEWKAPEIKPYGNLNVSPAMSVFHYGQAVFEGMKAYKKDGGDVFLFRPEENMRRMNLSAKRLCMPEIPLDVFKEGLLKLIEMDSGWVPTTVDSSLYIRPVLFASDEYIGVKPSSTYKFIIFTCPVNAYYSEPINVKIETEYTRAAAGGVGFAKAAGNYAASLFPAKLGQEKGYHQLIWTDAKEHKYIEESGTMNIAFMIDGKLITPFPGETILNGVTRDSVVSIARDWGIEVEERKVSVEEIVKAMKENKLKEAFGLGTAATIARIASITYENEEFKLPEISDNDFSIKVHKYMDSLKRGLEEDKFNWVVKV